MSTEVEEMSNKKQTLPEDYLQNNFTKFTKTLQEKPLNWKTNFSFVEMRVPDKNMDQEFFESFHSYKNMGFYRSAVN